MINNKNVYKNALGEINEKYLIHSKGSKSIVSLFNIR